MGGAIAMRRRPSCEIAGKSNGDMPAAVDLALAVPKLPMCVMTLLFGRGITCAFTARSTAGLFNTASASGVNQVEFRHIKLALSSFIRLQRSDGTQSPNINFRCIREKKQNRSCYFNFTVTD